MIYMLTAMLFLFSFVAPVFGSEKNENQVVIFAKVNPQRLELRYVGKDSIDRCNQFNMKAAYNSPCFIDCCYRSEDSRTNIFTFIDGCENMLHTFRSETSGGDITEFENKMNKWQSKYNRHCTDNKGGKIAETFLALTTMSSKPIPYQCFVSKKDPSTFKKVGDVLFSFIKNVDGQDVDYIVKLESNFGDRNPKENIAAFKTSQGLLCDIVHQEELCDAQIIAKGEYGQHLHGLNSFFAEKEKEVALTKEEAGFAQSVLQRQEAQKQSTLSYRQLFFGGLIIAGIMYILHQKLYTAKS